MDSDTDPNMPSLTHSLDENSSEDETELEIRELATDKEDSDFLDSDDENTGAPPLPSTHSTHSLTTNSF